MITEERRQKLRKEDFRGEAMILKELKEQDAQMDIENKK
jgi:hypothetical protein